MRTTPLVTIAQLLILCFTGCESPKSAAIPTALPVSAAKDGFTPQQIAAFRANWRWNRAWEAGDPSLYAYLHFTEFYPSAIVHRSGPVVGLDRQIDPKLGATRVNTSLG